MSNTEILEQFKMTEAEFLEHQQKRNSLPKRLRAKGITTHFPIALSTVWLYVKEGKLTPIKVSSRVTVFDTQEVMNLFSNEEM